MTEHTSGPWTVGTMTEYAYALGVGQEDGLALAVLTEDSNGGKKQQQANARLIAAAPDLLAALEAILPMTGAPHDYTIGDVWKAQEQARAAIAKARNQ